MNKKWIFSAVVLIAAGLLWAQPREVNRKIEKDEFKNLQATEAKQERNIKDAYDSFAKLGWLVDMVKKDRKTKLEQEADVEKGNLDFKKTFRFVKFTPRNTYVRYIKETYKKPGDILLVEFGTADDVNALIEKEVQKAKTAAVGVNAKKISFQNREGIELTQFDFVYGEDPDQRRAVGSRRKSLTLFFKNKNGKTGPDAEWDLDLVVAKVVRDNYRAGVRDVEMIIDSSPTDEGMDDVVILHRYNQKPTTAIVLGAMSNTPTHPNRLRFKQRFYVKVLDHFYRLYSMVANYATKDSNDYHRQVNEMLEHELDY